MCNVLVADDDSGSLQLMRLILERAGMTVHLAVDGYAVLRVARSVPVQCIILNDGMPHHTGAELCQALKAEPETAHIPVLLISAGLRISDPAYVASSGAAGVIHKPCLPAELVRIVTRHVSVCH